MDATHPRAVYRRIDVLLGKICPSFLDIGHWLHGVGIPVGQRWYGPIKRLQLASFSEGQADQDSVSVQVKMKELSHSITQRRLEMLRCCAFMCDSGNMELVLTL